jgi:hypothetical protein
MDRCVTGRRRARWHEAVVVVLGVVGLLLAGLHPTVAPRAEAATAVLSPNGDVSNGWQVKPGGAAWAAVDDAVSQPTAVPSTDYLYAGSANAVVQLGMSSTAIGANAASSGQVWFYANTGPGTQLRVEALWSGAVRATSTVPAGQGFAWRSVAVAPSGQADVDDLRLRFTALGGGDTNVRAVYVTLDAVALLRSLTWENAPERTLPGAAPSGWNKQWCCTDSAQLSTTVVRAGGYASRFELRDTDADVSASKRAELSSAVVDPDNSERWYGFSIYLPADTWAPDPSAEVLAQWHQDSPDGSPPLSIDTHAGNWEVAVFGNAVPLVGPSQAYATNGWTDWVVHVTWSANTQGLIEIWRGADLVYRQTGKATKADDHKGVYAKFGVYKWGWKGVGPTPVTHRRVVLHDELRIGDQSASRAAVAPR